MKGDTARLLDLLKKRELLGREELAVKLAQIKRECSPEFAERVETYLRSNNLLPPKDKARQ
jgi:hypothetical protein